MFYTDFFNNIFDDELLAKLNELEKRIDQLSQNMSKVMKELSIHGWYISANSEVYGTIKLIDDIRNGKIEKVDRIMKSYYDSRFDYLIKNLNSLYPERKKIFMQASKAHKLKMYYASIPLFLSQADGICKGHLFILKNEKKNLKMEVSRMNSPTLKEVLDVILTASAIDAPYSNGSKFPSKLNRHAVLHGIDFEYGNKLNSLKAFSLLAFIGDFFNRYRTLGI